jgi:predicted nucleic acid-binding protein
MGKAIDLLIDTDVVLDLLLNRPEYSDDAAKVLSLCELGRLKGYITPIIFGNIYYFVQKSMGTSDAVRTSLALLNIVDLIPNTKNSIQDALLSAIPDKEDAMQSLAASHSNRNISAIITRNIKDYKLSAIPALSPSDFLLDFNQ